jgi:cell division protein FtsL
MYRERVEKLNKEYEELDEKIGDCNTKFDKYSKAVSDTSSINNIKNMMQKLQVNII